MTIHVWRIVATLIGIGLAGLGAWGAYEYALRLEGQVTYLVIAAPLVALMAALIPPLAERTWRAGHRFLATLWWLALIPAAAMVFLAVAERTHYAKAGASAERSAVQAARNRAEEALRDARSVHAKAQAEADRFSGVKQCGPQCQRARGTAEATLQRVVAAEGALTKADSGTRSEAELAAPAWLLPAALDICAFLALWTGLSGPWIERKQSKLPTKSRRRPKRKRRGGRKAPIPTPRQAPNVVAIRP